MRGSAPPAKRRLYYGWVIVAVVALGGMVQTGQLNPTIGVFVKPITEEFGWSRTTFVGAMTIGTILGGLSSLIVGPAMDRYGPRWIIAGGFLVIGAALVGMAFVDRLWQFYLSMIVGRMVVQGGINLSLQVTVAKWFVRKRGRAMALSGLGVRVGNGISPLYTAALVTAFDWRAATLVLGLVTWALAVAPSALFLRRQPEDMGLRPDGDEDEPASGPASGLTEQKGGRKTGAEVEYSFTLRQALHTPTFYVLTSVLVVLMFAASGANLHLVAYFTDQGLSTQMAAGVVTVFSITAMVGTLGGGLLSERMPVRLLLMGAFAGMALSTFILLQVRQPAMGFVFGVVSGVSFGAMVTMMQMILPTYFGRRHAGAIRGTAQPLLMISNGLGPLAAAVVYDHTKSYEAIFLIFLALYIAGIVLLWLTKPPRRPVEQAQAV